MEMKQLLLQLNGLPYVELLLEGLGNPLLLELLELFNSIANVAFEGLDFSVLFVESFLLAFFKGEELLVASNEFSVDVFLKVDLLFQGAAFFVGDFQGVVEQLVP